MKPGDWIARRFQIERLAGSGAMGAVYRAWDAMTGHVVAVKVLHGHRLEHTARFEREALALASLRHQAIVRYVAHGTDESGDPFLAMQWVDGESLADRLARGRVGVAETVTLGRTIADALALVHRRGGVHRDLKPSNVMLVGGAIEQALLVDFGIAHVADRTRLTATGAMLGTVGFMPPEQVRGDGVDARADVYALGAMLFRMLAGQMPFPVTDALGMMLAQSSQEAPRLSAVLEGVPPPLDALVARMLSRMPATRPPDGAAVAWELAGLGPIAANPPLPQRVAGGQTVPSYGMSASTMPVTPTNPPQNAAFPPPSTFGAAVQSVHGTAPPQQPRGKTSVILAVIGALTVLGVAAIVTIGYVATYIPEAPAGAGGDCPPDTCRVFPVEDYTEVEPSALYPRVAAVAREIDPKATLMIAGTDAGIQEGRVDLSRVKLFYHFLMADKRAINMIITTKSRRTRLEWAFQGTGNALVNMKPVPPPVCPVRKVLAEGKKQGFSAKNVAFSYLTYAVDDQPTWYLRDADDAMKAAMIHDADCVKAR